jgi:hypothetical protein
MAQENFFTLLDRAPKVDFNRILTIWNRGGVSVGQQSGAVGNFDGLIFKQYKSFDTSFEAIEEARKDPDKEMTSGLQLNTALNFVRSSKFDNLKSYKDFLNNTKPEFETGKEVANAISSATKSLINLAGSFKKDRIEVTSDERGIFDFSLASQGLYRPIEFYSEDFAKSGGEEFAARLLPSGVIPPEFVDREENAFGYFYTYTDPKGKKFGCERRQIGTTDVFNTFPTKCLLKKNDQGIVLPYYLDDQEKVFNGEGTHRLKYATNSKNVYLLFDRQEESTKYVDIFIPVNFVGVSDGCRIANALIPILISSSLEEFGIKTRISAVRNGIDQGKYVSVSIPIKDYQERTSDKQDFILNLMGQEETASEFFAFHKVLTENEGQEQPDGTIAIAKDSASAFSDVFYYNRVAMLDLFSRYKNWIHLNQGKDFVETKVKDPSFQIFLFQAVGEGVPYFPSKMQQSPEAYLEQMPYILFEYFFFLDYLSIQYLPMRKFVTILLKRFEEDENFLKVFTIDRDRKSIKQTILQYVSGLMYYRYYATDTKAYADTPEQFAKKKEDYDNKINELTEVLKSY